MRVEHSAECVTWNSSVGYPKTRSVLGAWERNLAKVGVASSSLVFRSRSLWKEAAIKSKNLMYQWYVRFFRFWVEVVKKACLLKSDGVDTANRAELFADPGSGCNQSPDRKICWPRAYYPCNSRKRWSPTQSRRSNRNSNRNRGRVLELTRRENGEGIFDLIHIISCILYKMLFLEKNLKYVK